MINHVSSLKESVEEPERNRPYSAEKKIALASMKAYTSLNTEEAMPSRSVKTRKRDNPTLQSN
jgi:hypothetical protein